MITIACVYKSGGPYNEDYVKALKASLDINNVHHDRFVCLTDKPNEVKDYAEPIILTDDLPGWWSKIELFKPGRFADSETVIFFDLDTLILKELSQLIELCENANSPLMTRGMSVIAQENDFPSSGLMSWKGDMMSSVYREFFSIGPDEAIRRQKASPHGAGQRGDQGFIRKYIDPIRIQDYLQRWYVIFKKQYRRNGFGIVNRAHVLMWSGEPRLHEASSEIYKIWIDYVRRAG